MVKKFTINCKIGNQESPLDLFVGNPNDSSHPIGFQMKFFNKLGVEIPENVVKSLSNLNEIAKRNRIPFEELIQFVTDELNSSESVKNAFNKFNEISRSIAEEKQQQNINSDANN
jgi:hypothetical protein